MAMNLNLNLNLNLILAAALSATLLANVAGHSHDGMVHRQNIWAEPTQCSAHLSAGPADADVEIRLGGLPASNASVPVHLQWWTPRKSPTAYNPLVSPVNCSVYSNMYHAFPKYSDADFNGGNVRVSETGEAVIRVGAPSTYFAWLWVAIPHIHLRLCSGADQIHKTREGLTMAGPETWISPKDSSITILQSSYTPSSVTLTSSAAVRPSAVIVAVSGFDEATTTMEAATTTLAATTTTAAANGRGVLLSEARDRLDLSALQFSPVYACLLEEKFFDHFSSACKAECGEGAAVVHGQCVRGETTDSPVDLSRSWQLSLECGPSCWQESANATLHSVRLAVAGHLDIPFQEVAASLRFLSGLRRLTATAVSARPAILEITVQTNRLAASEVSSLMNGFGQDATSMTEALGLPVVSVVYVTPGSGGSGDSGSGSLGQGNDPYVPAYDDLERGLAKQSPSPTSSALDLLPTEAIIGIAVGVVVLGVLFAGFILYRRRRQRREAAEQAQAAKVAKVGGKDEKEVDADV